MGKSGEAPFVCEAAQYGLSVRLSCPFPTKGKPGGIGLYGSRFQVDGMTSTGRACKWFSCQRRMIVEPGTETWFYHR